MLGKCGSFGGEAFARCGHATWSRLNGINGWFLIDIESEIYFAAVRIFVSAIGGGSSIG